MILDSFNLMPSDCVLTDDKDKHHCKNPICAIFLYLVDALESNMRILFGKTLTH